MAEQSGRFLLFLRSPGCADPHQPSFFSAQFIVKRKIILIKECGITDQPRFTDHSEFPAQRIDRNRIIVLYEEIKEFRSFFSEKTIVAQRKPFPFTGSDEWLSVAPTIG